MKSLARLSVAVAIALPLAFTGVSLARAHSGAGVTARTDACRDCPKCRTPCCELKVEQVDEDKYCWKVECETICIPRVVFPWQKDCRNPSANNGARVKTVRVLKKHDYTCPKCEYSWTPIERGCGGVGCGGNVGCGTCDRLPIEMETSVEEPDMAPLPPPANRSLLGAGEPESIEAQEVSLVSFLSRMLGRSK